MAGHVQTKSNFHGPNAALIERVAKVPYLALISENYYRKYLDFGKTYISYIVFVNELFHNYSIVAIMPNHNTDKEFCVIDHFVLAALCTIEGNHLPRSVIDKDAAWILPRSLMEEIRKDRSPLRSALNEQLYTNGFPGIEEVKQKTERLLADEDESDRSSDPKPDGKLYLRGKEDVIDYWNQQGFSTMVPPSYLEVANILLNQSFSSSRHSYLLIELLPGSSAHQQHLHHELAVQIERVYQDFLAMLAFGWPIRGSIKHRAASIFHDAKTQLSRFLKIGGHFVRRPTKTFPAWARYKRSTAIELFSLVPGTRVIETKEEETAAIDIIKETSKAAVKNAAREAGKNLLEAEIIEAAVKEGALEVLKSIGISVLEEFTVPGTAIPRIFIFNGSMVRFNDNMSRELNLNLATPEIPHTPDNAKKFGIQ